MLTYCFIKENKHSLSPEANPTLVTTDLEVRLHFNVDGRKPSQLLNKHSFSIIFFFKVSIFKRMLCFFINFFINTEHEISHFTRGEFAS